MERYARRLVRRARTRTRTTVLVAIVVVVGLSMSVAGATGYLVPMQSGDTVAIGCNGSSLSQQRLSATISKLTCTGSTSTSTSTTSTTAPPNIDGQPPGAVTGGALWTRVFDDEFNNAQVDATQWNVQNNSTFGSGNNELECYMAANTTESGGSLNLAAQTGGAACPGHQVSSGMVTQRNQGGSQHFSFTHGYIEARIKVSPFTSALWPAFWLVGAEGTPSWPAYGEMDVVEMYGPRPGYAEPNYHDQRGAKGNVGVRVGDLASYHTYAMNWTSSQIQWFYDGTLVSSINVANNYPHSAILNLAVGGDGPSYYGNIGDPSSSLPATMSVDYVRVFQP